MPDFKVIAAYLAGEWAVIVSAPLTFVTQAIAIGVIMWLIQRWAYGTVISHKDGKIAHLEERLKMRDDQLSNKLQTTPPAEAQELIKALQSQIEAMKPRRLTEQQRTAISSGAIARGGATYNLSIVRDMGSADAEAYTDDLIRAFQNLQGWTISPAAALGVSMKAACGLALCVQNPQNLSPPERIVFDVLQSSGVEFEMLPFRLPQSDVELLVSTKTV